MNRYGRTNPDGGGRHPVASLALTVLLAVGVAAVAWAQPEPAPVQPAEATDATSQPEEPPSEPDAAPQDEAGLPAEPDAAPQDEEESSDETDALPSDEAESSDETGPPTGPRDLLRRLSVDESFFRNIRGKRPLQPAEYELVLQMLDRLPQFRQEDLERWAQPVFPLEEALADPEPHRGQIFWLAGRVVAMEPVELIPEVADRYGFWGYWLCTMVLADGKTEASILARTVPKAWEDKLAADRPLDERATAYGMFVKFAGDSSGQPGPMFTARRIAWHPPTPLGNLGFDVGLLDGVRNGKPLSAHDREAFYAMLAAVGRAEPGQLIREARKRLQSAPADEVRVDKQDRRWWSVVPLFNDPAAQQGKLFFLEGTVRRAERIEVNDPDIQARFGIDHYYQLALFTPDARNLGGPRNPVWFCVRQVPEDMPLGAETNYRVHLRVAGFFLKTWSYRRGLLPEETTGAKGPPMQLAPLLIGREPIYFPPSKQTGLPPMVGMIAGGLFMAALAGIWIAVWRYGRADREFQKQTLSKNYQVEDGVSLDELGLKANDGPDFRRMGEAEDGPPAASDSDADAERS